jgi:hypothetical protein
MRTLFIPGILALLQGCANMTFETRGFNPEMAAKIHRAVEGQRQFCTHGVAYEERRANVTVRTPPPDPDIHPIYWPRTEVKTTTREEITCR